MEPSYYIIEKYSTIIGAWMEVDCSVRPATKELAVVEANKMKEKYLQLCKDHNDKNIEFSIVPVYNSKGQRYVLKNE